MKRIQCASEDGMTLLEVLLAITISVIITGAIAAAFIIVLKANTAVETRAEHSHDAQLLAAYFPGDVVSGTPNGVDTGAATTSGCASTPAGSTNVVQLTWTDKATNTGYVSDYRVTASTGADGTTIYQLIRLTCAGATPSTVSPDIQIVARGLASLTSAVATPSAQDATVTIKIVDSDGYTFSITGSQRVGPDHHERALGAYDTDGDGKLDMIKMSFNGIVTSTCLPGFSVSGLPGNASKKTVAVDSVDATTVDISLNESTSTSVDTTVGAGLTASFAVQDQCKLVAYSGTPADKMPPVLQNVAAFDTNTNGELDSVVATYTEPVSSAGAASDWTVSNIPGGGTFGSTNAVSASGSTAVLTLTEGSIPNTAVTGMTVAGGAVTDSSGNSASPVTVAQPIIDKARPVYIGPAQAFDNGGASTANGKIDRIGLTFSEPITTTAGGTTSWSLANAPSGDTISNTAPTINGSTIQVVLTEGAGTANTAMPSGFTISAISSGTGAKDSAGNVVVPFTATPTDKAGPMAVALTSTNAGATGTSTGTMENGDSVTITFSEPLVGLPSTMTVTETNANPDSWSASGGGMILTSSSTLANNNCVGGSVNGTISAPASVAVTPSGTLSVVKLTLTAAPTSAAGGTVTRCSSAAYAFTPATGGGLADAAGNALAATTFTASSARFM